MTITATPIVNAAIARARDLPSLIQGLTAINPTLAQQLEAKPLLASRSPWGTLAAGIIGWASAHYGLGLDANTTLLVAGLFVLAGSYAMRAVTRQAVAGIVEVPVGTPPDIAMPSPPPAPVP